MCVCACTHACVYVCVFAHIHIDVHHGVPMEVREQISGVFYTLCESHLLDAGQQSLLQVLLLTELSGHIIHNLNFFFIFMLFLR